MDLPVCLKVIGDALLVVLSEKKIRLGSLNFPNQGFFFFTTGIFLSKIQLEN